MKTVVEGAQTMNRAPAGSSSQAAAPGGHLRAVMFHAYKASDCEADAMIRFAARSMLAHYPQAEIVLLTNEEGGRAKLPDFVRVEVSDIDIKRLMLERIRLYRECVETAAPGEALVFLDTDMLVVRRFDELLRPDIDIAVTVRSWGRPTVPGDFYVPINGGLYVVNAARHEAVRRFFDRFLELYEALPADRHAWDGDQIIVAELLDPPSVKLRVPLVAERNGLRVCFAPVRHFNNTPRPWSLRLATFRPGSRVLHFKGPRKRHMQRYASRYLSGGYLAFARWMDRLAAAREAARARAR